MRRSSGWPMRSSSRRIWPLSVWGVRCSCSAALSTPPARTTVAVRFEQFSALILTTPLQPLPLPLAPVSVTGTLGVIDAVARPLTDRFAVDRLDALHASLKGVRRGGTVSIVGVYGPTFNAVPIGNVVNKGLTLRANQASVKRLLPRLIEHVKAGHIEPKKLITHKVPLEEIADAYHIFSDKLDECIKPVLVPAGA